MGWLCHALFNPQLVKDIWVVPGVGLLPIKLLRSSCRKRSLCFSGIWKGAIAVAHGKSISFKTSRQTTFQNGCAIFHAHQHKRVTVFLKHLVQMQVGEGGEQRGLRPHC